MFMPKAQGFKFIVAARDDLSKAAEGCALRSLDSHQLSTFFFEQRFTIGSEHSSRRQCAFTTTVMSVLLCLEQNDASRT